MTDWEEQTAYKFDIPAIRFVETIWAVGQGIVNNIRPKTDIAKIYLDENGKLTEKGNEIYQYAERLRRIEIRETLENIRNDL